jgi:hypothetical protein
MSKKLKRSKRRSKKSAKKPLILSAVALAAGGAIGKVFLSSR